MIQVKLPDGHTYSVDPNRSTYITGTDGHDYLIAPGGQVTRISGVDAPVIIAGPMGPTVAAGTAIGGALKSAAGPIAGALAGKALKDLSIGAAVAFVFGAAGSFAKGFGKTLADNFGAMNERYIVGLAVAAVVVFVLFAGGASS